MRLLAALSLVGHVAGQSGDGPKSLGYELKFVDTKLHPLAVCNDGSPAAYYLYKGDPSAWVVHQQGGWWCWDAYSCQVRWDHFANHTTDKRTLMSTKDLAALTEAHDTRVAAWHRFLVPESPRVAGSWPSARA
jgi:hypothetical protein